MQISDYNAFAIGAVRDAYRTLRSQQKLPLIVIEFRLFCVRIKYQLLALLILTTLIISKNPFKVLT